MIDLGWMKNCLNCSYFTLMLNTAKRGSTGKLLATAEREIKPFMPPKNCPPPHHPSSSSPSLFNCQHLPGFTCSLPFLYQRTFQWLHSPAIFSFFQAFISYDLLHQFLSCFLNLYILSLSLWFSHPSLSAPVSRLCGDQGGGHFHH